MFIAPDAIVPAHEGLETVVHVIQESKLSIFVVRLSLVKSKQVKTKVQQIINQYLIFSVIEVKARLEFQAVI